MTALFSLDTVFQEYGKQRIDPPRAGLRGAVADSNSNAVMLWAAPLFLAGPSATLLCGLFHPLLQDPLGPTLLLGWKWICWVPGLIHSTAIYVTEAFQSEAIAVKAQDPEHPRSNPGFIPYFPLWNLKMVTV